jgi:hypothetical protein
MRSRASVTIVAMVAGFALAAPLLAGGDKVAFPANYASGVLYWVQDRPGNNPGVREYYAGREAVEAVKKGLPIPSGTVITAVNYSAKLDADKKPLLDSNRRFIKDAIRGFIVMEKRTGWGTEYSWDVRNGEWEYQSFTTDKTPTPNANLTNCFTCHKLVDDLDFVYSLPNMKVAELPRTATR